MPQLDGSVFDQLHSLAQSSRNQSLAGRFADDPERAARYSAQVGPLYVDYAKHHLDPTILSTLLTLAEQAELPARFADMATGALLNNTEERPVNYPQLRRQGAEGDGNGDIGAMFGTMERLVTAVRTAQWRGPSGKPYRHVVNIGIGGSDFGPRLLCDALPTSATGGDLTSHFVANIDPDCIERVLSELPLDQTLFIVASKSFSTQETQYNAQHAMAALKQLRGTDSVADQFIAVTAKPSAAAALGIPEAQIVAVPDWVGGRFSLWSGFGIAIALSKGMAVFRQVLQGGALVDDHVASTPLKDNIPALLGLLDVWYRNGWDCSSQVVLPYSHRLALLPTYLQQLFMESAGKSVAADGTPLAVASGNVLWGSEGTNGQHSFHQLLHQGSDMIPADFIASVTPPAGGEAGHAALLANCFAQSLVLMEGQDPSALAEKLCDEGLEPEAAMQLARHKAMPGNRPSTTILLENQGPQALGALIALYEYRLLTASFIWGLNPFDQWGVELGKQVGKQLLSAIDSGDLPQNLDSSTRNLMEKMKAGR
ncbi:glucose-6-phosphate isomerase [Spongiibacter nanhainus]|uniref:Glucose-6-phosphate isomerase n=1 Tax=Spongiibacter nanhainus TaxID=2794344 RepID=A0A7T4QZ67_9GAMM|nr:glucose-6-phosphate isomerase [Spongiibacter nanhainus]QQD17499.1 glucose-6-phosphate isomerase [Spongiibacter nanhainus]